MTLARWGGPHTWKQQVVGHVKVEVLHPSSSDGFRMTAKGRDGAEGDQQRSKKQVPRCARDDTCGSGEMIPLTVPVLQSIHDPSTARPDPSATLMAGVQTTHAENAQFAPLRMTGKRGRCEGDATRCDAKRCDAIPRNNRHLTPL